MADLNLRALLSANTAPLPTWESAEVCGTEPPGEGWTYKGELTWEPPDTTHSLVENPPRRLIEVPDIRQKDAYSCGACSAMACGQYFGVGPRKIEAWKKALGTSLKRSTHPEAIIFYLAKLGLEVEANQGLSVLDLYLYWQRGMPVICPVQDYGRRREPGAAFAYGHYLTVIGCAFGYIFAQDPSEDNVLREAEVTPGTEEETIQAPGKVMIHEEEFLREWHDKDIDGNEFWHFGIAVSMPQRRGA